MPANKESVSTWQTVNFGDVVREVKEKIDREDTTLERYVAGGHMDSDDFHLRRWGLMHEDDVGPAFHRLFRKGQILYGSRRTYLKKVSVAPFDGICANTTFVLEGSAPETLLPELIPFVMLSEPFTKHAISKSRGSTNPYVVWKDIACYEFALPPLEEQRVAAEILSALDHAVEAIRESLTNCERLRRVMLFKIMSGKSSPGPKQQTKVGELPSAWNVALIRDSGNVQLGRQRSPKYQTGKHTKPYLRVANVFDGRFNFDDVLDMDFDERDFQTYSLSPGDILLNEGQSRELVGRCAIYNGQIEDCCFQNTLIRFRVGPSLKPDFAFLYFQYLFYKGVFSSIARQTTSIAHLGAERFGKLPMAIPPLLEQERFVDVLNSIQSEYVRIQRHLQRLVELKRALVVAVLSGKPKEEVLA